MCFFFNPSPVRRVPIPNRYTAKAKFCFCKNNKRMIIIWSPPRNRRRPATAPRAGYPVPDARPRPLVLGYGPALGEVGTLVPDQLPAFPTAPRRRPRRPRPAERARPGSPPRRLPGQTPVHRPAAIRQRQACKQPRRGRARRSRADGTISGLAVGHCD